MFTVPQLSLSSSEHWKRNAFKYECSLLPSSICRIIFEYCETSFQYQMIHATRAPPQFLLMPYVLGTLEMLLVILFMNTRSLVIRYVLVFTFLTHLVGVNVALIRCHRYYQKILSAPEIQSTFAAFAFTEFKLWLNMGPVEANSIWFASEPCMVCFIESRYWIPCVLFAFNFHWIAVTLCMGTWLCLRKMALDIGIEFHLIILILALYWIGFTTFTIGWSVWPMMLTVACVYNTALSMISIFVSRQHFWHWCVLAFVTWYLICICMESWEFLPFASLGSVISIAQWSNIFFFACLDDTSNWIYEFTSSCEHALSFLFILLFIIVFVQYVCHLL